MEKEVFRFTRAELVAGLRYRVECWDKESRSWREHGLYKSLEAAEKAAFGLVQLGYDEARVIDMQGEN